MSLLHNRNTFAKSVVIALSSKGQTGQMPEPNRIAGSRDNCPIWAIKAFEIRWRTRTPQPVLRIIFRPGMRPYSADRTVQGIGPIHSQINTLEILWNGGNAALFAKINFTIFSLRSINVLLSIFPPPFLKANAVCFRFPKSNSARQLHGGAHFDNRSRDEHLLRRDEDED